MTERRTDIPAFASVVKQKMKELFDHHVLIYEGNLRYSSVRTILNFIVSLLPLSFNTQQVNTMQSLNSTGDQL